MGKGISLYINLSCCDRWSIRSGLQLVCKWIEYNERTLKTKQFNTYYTLKGIANSIHWIVFLYGDVIDDTVLLKCVDVICLLNIYYFIVHYFVVAKCHLGFNISSSNECQQEECKHDLSVVIIKGISIHSVSGFWKHPKAKDGALNSTFTSYCTSLSTR